MGKKQKKATKGAPTSSTQNATATRSNAKVPRAVPRRHAMCVRFPSAYKPHRPKSIMKFESLDDSLHATYGVVDQHDSTRKLIVEIEVPQKELRFGTTTVHFFENILGDNPATSNGPPLTIGWLPFNSATVSVDTFEWHRPEPEQQRHRTQLAIPALERQERLELGGYTRKQITMAVRDINKTKIKRRRTRSIKHREKEEEIIETIRRKGMLLLRACRPWGQLRTIDEEDELWTQANTCNEFPSSHGFKVARAA